MEYASVLPFLVLLLASVPKALAIDSEFQISYGLMWLEAGNVSVIEPTVTRIDKSEACCSAEKGFGYIVQKVGGGQFRHYTAIDVPGEGPQCEVTMTHEVESNGAAYAFLRLNDDDPSGTYKVDVYVNGEQLKHIEFEVR